MPYIGQRLSLLLALKVMVIVVWAYHHIPVDASNHYAPEPSVVFPTVCIIRFHE
jgi:hypothetical protein